MRSTRVAAAVLCAGMLFAVPVTATAVPLATDSVVHHQVGYRGDLVSAQVIAQLSREQVATYLAGYDLDPASARHGVDLYLVGYRTVGVDGKPTTASALSVLPRTDARTLRTVAWLHGTRAYREYTGSMSENLDRAAAVQFAAAGYVTAAPDYLGLGVGPGHHPYMLTKPTVTASIDSLRATRTLAARVGKRLDRKVLVTGFSQGGQASMLVGRALQQGADGYFRLAALAPIAGPHDIRGQELPSALDGRLDGRSAGFYLGYAMTAWNRSHDIYESPGDAFRAPYDQTVEGLFDGTHTEEEIFAALPATPQELFTDSFLAELANPTGTLRRVLAVNDDACRDWRPRVPVRLYAGTADRDVVFSNSESCQRTLAGSGTKATLVNLGDIDHFTSGHRALPQILTWFNTLNR